MSELELLSLFGKLKSTIRENEEAEKKRYRFGRTVRNLSFAKLELPILVCNCMLNRKA
jgi:hypothetical protein